MNCIIIDDDYLMQTLLKSFVSKSCLLNCLGAYNNPIEAKEVLENNTVDLIFLDIEMPQMSGFDYLDSEENNSQIIVISGNEKYALNTFEYGITDYLLKPFSYDRFIKSVNKAIDRHIDYYSCVGDDFIFAKKNGCYSKLLHSDICYILFDEDNAVIETCKEKFVFDKKSKLESLLTVDTFARIGNCELVNLEKVTKLGSDNIVIISDNKEKYVTIEEDFYFNIQQKIKK